MVHIYSSDDYPFNKNIPSQRSSELFGSISEDAKQNFFLLQGKRRLEREFLAYDTTSISSYSKLLKQLKYLFKNYTMQELLDELEIIECYEQPGRKHRIGEMTKKQMKLYECLGVDVPS